MIIKDEGLLIYEKIIKENNLFIKLLTKENGLRFGIVYGGNSKKNKVIYQLGNFINFHLSQKNENFASNIYGEITNPLMSNLYNDKYKLHSVLCCCSLINIAINENQHFQYIYNSSKDYFISLNNKFWFYEFSRWVFNYLKELGYGFDTKNINFENRFLNTDSLLFIDNKNKDNFDKNHIIEFPYDLYLNKIISFKQVLLFFNFFEFIMKNLILDDSKKKIPKIYFDFKEIILNRLLNKND
tara:strand:- start:2838 stop:3560 length:723 start_codon:yes stop_codon:yes gene_type:complete